LTKQMEEEDKDEFFNFTRKPPAVKPGDYVEITFKFPYGGPVKQGDQFEVSEVRANGDIMVKGEEPGYERFFRVSDYKVITEKAEFGADN
jgi:hypothetical protein